MRYNWDSGGYDYLQAFGMSPRNSAIAGYITALSKNPCTILDAASGLCPVVPFLPQGIISRYVAFDNSRYVYEKMPYKGLENFEFYMMSFEDFFAQVTFKGDLYDFVLYLGMYGGFDIYVERLKRLLPYTKPKGHVILEAIDEHISDVLSVMEQKFPDYNELASCHIEIKDKRLSHLTRERFRSIHLYQVP